MRTPIPGLVLLTALAVACAPADSPTLPGLPRAEVQAAAPVYSGAYVTTFIECVVSVWVPTPSTTCRSASQPYRSTNISAALVTQQCSVACLDATTPVYNQKGGWFAVDLRIRTGSSQALGTADGVTAASRGTALVLLETPRSLAGVGTIGVLDPKHRISAHPSLPRDALYSFFGGIIRPGQSTAWRPWLFRVPQSVQRFAFRVAIVTDVEPRVRITEVLPGLRNADASIAAGAMVELQNVGVAPISNTTLLVLDSLSVGPARAPVVAGVPVGILDEWRPGERRVVAAQDLARVLLPSLAGWFPSRYIFDSAWQHNLRVVSGGRGGRVLDEVVIVQRTFAASGVAWERSSREMGVSSTKIMYPAWTGVTTVAPTRCAGEAGCPVFKATPGR